VTEFEIHDPGGGGAMWGRCISGRRHGSDEATVLVLLMD
jgi:hypothetical protein